MTRFKSSVSKLTFGLAAAQTALIAPLSPALANTDAEAAWDVIRSVDVQEIVTDTTYEARKTFPDVLANGINGFELTGFVMLTLSEENVEEFILVSDMGACPYCGSGDHGATVQVKLGNAADRLQDGARITVQGALMPVYDPETWQSTILENARIVY
ncbi:MAG: hypothetical protein ACWA40_10970 [Planktomarina sp.]